MSNTVNSSQDSFDRDVPQAGIAVVDFWAAWCGPCRSFAPVFAESSTRHTDVIHLKVDVDENQQLAERYDIRSIPTTMFIRDGIVVGRVAGALSPARLEDLIGQTRELDMKKVRMGERT